MGFFSPSDGRRGLAEIECNGKKISLHQSKRQKGTSHTQYLSYLKAKSVLDQSISFRPCNSKCAIEECEIEEDLNQTAVRLSFYFYESVFSSSLPTAADISHTDVKVYQVSFKSLFYATKTKASAQWK